MMNEAGLEYNRSTGDRRSVRGTYLVQRPLIFPTRFLSRPDMDVSRSRLD